MNVSGLLGKGHWFPSLDGWLDVLSTAAEDFSGFTCMALACLFSHQIINFSLFPTLGHVSEQQISSQNITFYTVRNYFCQYERSCFYNSLLPEIPSCPPGTQMNLPFPLLKHILHDLIKITPNCLNEPSSPTQTPCFQAFYFCRFYTRKCLRSPAQHPTGLSKKRSTY